MFKIGIVDDDLLDLNMISDILLQYLNKHEIDARVSKINQVDDDFYNKDFDILFLDLEMGDVLGSDVARRFLSNHDCLIIFITSHSEMIYDSIKVHPYDFIRKECLQDELVICLKDALEFLKNNIVSFSFRSNYYNIRKNEILYCESYGHVCLIHYDAGVIKVKMKLSEVAKMINDPNFIQVSQSYLVNMARIKRIENYIIYFNDVQIKISRRYRYIVREFFNGGKLL